MSWKRLVLLLFVCYVAYLLYLPVPENINQSFRFRSGMALIKFCQHLGLLSQIFAPGVTNVITVYRGVFGFLTHYVLPSGEIYAPDVKLERTTFDGVKVHVYTPPGVGEGELLAGFVYLHAGGFALFDVDHFDGLTRQISKELNAVVVSVEYRRTPEYTFPIPHEDSLKATRWFLKNAGKYGVDAERVGIGGDSAGGYLSATVTQAIQDDSNIPNIKIQVLIYPWLQIVDLQTPSHQNYRHIFGSNGIGSLESVSLLAAMFIYGEEATQTQVQAFMTNNHTSEEFKNSAFYESRMSHSIVPDKYRTGLFYTEPSNQYPNSGTGHKIWSESKQLFLDQRMSPLFREDLSGLPPTYIVTVEHDSLRDDGIIYAKLLEQAGVDVTWRHYEDGFHGVVWVGPGIIFDLGSKILDEMYAFVRVRL